MSFTEAFKGAKAELATIHAPIDKLKKIAVYARIIGAELLSTLQIIPYGIRSQALYRSLPEVRLEAKHQGSISTARNLCYGPRQRNTLDIYLPAEVELDHATLIGTLKSNVKPNDGTKVSKEVSSTKTITASEPATASTNQRLPVVLFCHGGIWATGEKWHYAPLATRLAQAGIVTAIMSYSLYPTAQASEMAEEVSQALTWTFDSISKFGGDPENITLAGHSAGAQLCAMALLHRAKNTGSATGEKNKVDTAVSSETITADPTLASSAAFRDNRMPRRFVGMAGVYDIAKHYEYEQARGVHTLSTMERAVGGPSGFAANSPSVILRATAATLEERKPENITGSRSSEIILESELLGHLENTRFKSKSSSSINIPQKSAKTTTSLHTLQGDELAKRIGLDRASVISNSTSTSHSSVDNNKIPTPLLKDLPLTLPQLRTLPPTILQASISDVTVPWYESSEMYWALHDCSIPSKALIYKRVGHGDFVVNWRPLPTPLDVHTTEDLHEYAADFVNIVLGEVKDLRYSRLKRD